MFASKSIDYIYSSDLVRAFETAQALSEHQPVDVTR
ncbi:histidine phosphatase family protein [Anaerobacillus sp. HL2]|nr:histidine phosphatase family protein [Anaerobacillus sp. HL2]